MKSAGEISLLDPAVQEDCFPAYDILRAEAPVTYMPDLGMYVLTRFDDIRAVLLRGDIFTVGTDVTSDSLFTTDAAKSIYSEKGWPRYQALSENNPKHRAYRSLVDPTLSPAAVRRREPFVQATINELIDAWINDGSAEFVEQFANPLPMIVIAEILGLPRIDLPQLKQWSNAWVLPYMRGLTAEQEIWAAQSHVEMQHYIYDTMQDRRKRPREDLISKLVHAKFEDPISGETRPLNEVELIGILDNLLVGGNETTAFAIANAMWLLFRFPDVYERVQQDRGLVPRFVEEALRMESPTQGLQRFATKDVEIGGVRIAKGSTLHLRYGAGNHDPEKYACPHLMDIDRKGINGHLAFAQGEHHCAGAALSRLEMRNTWDILLRRTRNLRPAPGKNDFAHIPGLVLRSLKALHIEFDSVDID